MNDTPKVQSAEIGIVAALLFVGLVVGFSLYFGQE